MKTTTKVSIPELAALAATRVAGGAGLAMLLAPRLGKTARKRLGWTLLGIGVLSTIPIGMKIFGSQSD